jgi:hypothetical protein
MNYSSSLSDFVFPQIVFMNAKSLVSISGITVNYKLVNSSE